MSGKVPIALLAAALLASCAGPANLHRVDAKVWRSSQPTRQDFRSLKKEGIGEVLCLRRWHSDTGHGHHAEVFPNIRSYLETVDVEKLRREVYR